MIRNLRFDFITFSLAAFLLSLSCFAEKLLVSPEKNYLRLEIEAQKNDIDIIKEGNDIRLNFFNDNLFSIIKKEFSENKTVSTYIKEIKNLKNSQIILTMVNPEVELFSFYRDGTQSYVLDLWSSRGAINKKSESADLDPVIKETVKTKSEVIKKVTKVVPLFVQKEVKSIENNIEKDFRYGASFFWDYQPLMPKIRTSLTTKNKTPEHFYPIIDRKYKENKLESHLQAAIEFFRKEKYGFMSKSINLFEEAYPKNKEGELISYLKGNALLRQYIKSQNSEYLNTSLTLFEELAERSQDYELKKSLYLYLIHFYIDSANIIKSLENGKRLYVIGTENFDEDAIYFSSEVILNSLARLRQRDKIEQFLKEPVVKKFLKEQVGIGYKIYVMLLNRQYNEIISYYDSIKDGLQKPVEPSIIFNVGESYFQVAEYRNAMIQNMDFVKNYSYLQYSSFARNRIALSSDLLGGKRNDVARLYREAIDLSSMPKARYEAKLRYVGFEYLRSNKSSVNENILSLLEYSQTEESQVDDQLKKLLWLVRLRSFIVNEKFKQAITYYQTIPLNILTFYDREVFEQDFHEALYGYTKELYEKNQHADVVKTSELYKEINEKYAKEDHSMNYYVGLSYLQLGFIAEFSQIIESFRNNDGALKVKEFPVWIKRNQRKVNFANIYMKKLMAEKKWEELEKYYLSLSNNKNIYLQEKYLYSLFMQDKWKNYVSEAEKIFLKGEYKNIDHENFNRLVVNYVVSMKQSNTKHYLKKLEAIIRDPYITKLPRLLEKILYTLAEEYSVDKLKNARSIATVWTEFDRSFPQSDYHSRVKYIYGISLIKSFNKEKGLQVLKEIISDEKSPKYLKKLAQTELTFSGEITKI